MKWSKTTFRRESRRDHSQESSRAIDSAEKFLYRIGRTVLRITVILVALSAVPTVSAHGSSHAPDVPQWYGLLALAGGVGILGFAIYVARRWPIRRPKFVLAGAFLGLIIAVFGSIVLVELSQVETLTARQLLFARSWYPILSVGFGGGIVLGSMLVGQRRWPTRPRYAGLGVLLGLWVAYPGLMSALVGPSRVLSHPLGYVIVVSVPVAVGYILWRDARQMIPTVLADPLARWFGVGVGVLMTTFFMFSTGMLQIIPDDGVGLSWTHSTVVTIPVTNPLVFWPALEWWFPHIPFGGYLSIGMVLVLGVIGVLIGLNAAVTVRTWQADIHAENSSTATGAVAVAGPNACCCCGPVLSELAVIALGPSTAAPIYWLFVDIASPVGAIFFAGSVILLTGNLLQSASNPRVCELQGGA